MQSSLSRLGCGACMYLLCGCGGSSANFFDAPSDAGSSATSSAGASAQAGSNSGPGSAGSNSGPSNANAPCGPVQDATGGSDVLNTTSAVCVRVSGNIAGWGCSNFDGRSVKVNGQTVTCGATPLPGALAGAYYFDISAGTLAYASFYWF